MQIGFIGLGKMGTAIVQNLLGAGHHLTVYNRTPEKTREVAKAGAQVASSPAEASAGAEAVFTMLADDAAVSDVVWGNHGVLAGLSTGATHISSSTISVDLVKRLTEAHSQGKQHFVSAPVFGRPDAAAARRLIVMTAGPAETLEKFRPLFDAIGRKTATIGSEPWQANAVKLSGNFMIASVMEAFGETFALMRKAGVDPHTFLDVMTELFGSPVYQNYGTTIVDRKFEPAAFALKLGLKDIRLALEAAGECQVRLPFAEVLRDHFASAIEHGQEQFDWSSIALVPEREAGLPVPGKSANSQSA